MAADTANYVTFNKSESLPSNLFSLRILNYKSKNQYEIQA